jgi:hypothetical protein
MNIALETLLMQESGLALPVAPVPVALGAAVCYVCWLCPGEGVVRRAGSAVRARAWIGWCEP